MREPREILLELVPYSPDATMDDHKRYWARDDLTDLLENILHRLDELEAYVAPAQPPKDL